MPRILSRTSPLKIQIAKSALIGTNTPNPMRFPAAFPCLAFALAILCTGCGAKKNLPLDRQIDELIQTAHTRDGFSGNVLVTRRDETLYEKSVGLADSEQARPNTADTRFLAFSLLKPLTAVLVFQQIEAGKLQLSESLATFFPNLSGKPVGALTVHQLLTHTSGISEVISDHLDRRITARDLEAAAVKANGEFEYSNTAYVVLGLVLESVTGKTYEALLQEKILRPVSMQDSGLARTGQPVANVATGYQRQEGKNVPAQMGVSLEALDGAGSLYTTTRDLWRFDQALVKETILSKKSQDLMLTQQVKGRYGYGWFLSEQSGRFFPWHKGDYRGYTAIFVRQIHRRETIIILSNQQETDVSDLRTKLLRLLKSNPGS